jgi:hypothetical protein
MPLKSIMKAQSTDFNTSTLEDSDSNYTRRDQLKSSRQPLTDYEEEESQNKKVNFSTIVDVILTDKYIKDLPNKEDSENIEKIFNKINSLNQTNFSHPSPYPLPPYHQGGKGKGGKWE